MANEQGLSRGYGDIRYLSASEDVINSSEDLVHGPWSMRGLQALESQIPLDISTNICRQSVEKEPIAIALSREPIVHHPLRDAVEFARICAEFRWRRDRLGRSTFN